MSLAIGMIELSSISRGFATADSMLKAANVEMFTATSACPGKYIVIVRGDVASVKSAVDAGRETAGAHMIECIVIPNIEPSIFSAIVGTTMPSRLGALGVIETFSLANMMSVADAVLKAANIEAIEMRLGNGIGGKAFFTFTGDVAAVAAGIDAGTALASESGLLVNTELIPSPDPSLFASLF